MCSKNIKIYSIGEFWSRVQYYSWWDEADPRWRRGNQDPDSGQRHPHRGQQGQRPGAPGGSGVHQPVYGLQPQIFPGGFKYSMFHMNYLSGICTIFVVFYGCRFSVLQVLLPSYRLRHLQGNTLFYIPCYKITEQL